MFVSRIPFVGNIVTCVLQIMIGSVVQSITVVLSHRHCCYGRATMHNLSAVELHVTVNNMKALNVVMGTQQWIYFALLPSCELFRNTATDIQVLPPSCKCPIFLSNFRQIWSATTNFRGNPQHKISSKSVQ